MAACSQEAIDLIHSIIPQQLLVKTPSLS